jgi:predicted  nucleic acid-binding Zn-ribbon protein
VNPTRMTEIGRLAATLAKRIATPCPSCAAPGFGIVRREAGLPCADCETPTTLVRRLVSGCALCGHEIFAPRPDGRSAASPAECPECNP